MALLKASRKAFKGLASPIRCYFPFASSVELNLSLSGKSTPPAGVLSLTRHPLFSSTLIHSGRSAISFASPSTGPRALSYTRRMGSGFRGGGGGESAFPNFARREINWKPPRHFGDGCEFTRLAYVPFLFPVRVQSEALGIRRDHTGVGGGDSFHTP